MFFYKQLLTRCIRKLAFFVPKKRNAILFYSIPDYSDSCRAMYEELIQRKMDDRYDMKWVLREKNLKHKFKSVGRRVRYGSMAALWAALRSKYIIVSHTPLKGIYVPEKQILIKAWHGMLIKGYRHSELGHYPKNGHDYFCVTSPLFQRLFSQMLSVDPRRFNITGLPRNDYLFQQTSNLKNILNLNTYSKIILWMPTFRTHMNGETEGKESCYGLPTLEHNDLSKVNATLQRRNYLLLVKLHPLSKQMHREIPSFSHIREVSDDDIPEEYHLYHLLAQADALISDYSSVYVDYLLVDKPIGFAFDDLEEYAKDRLIPLTPLEEYMPGMRIRNRDELIEFVESLAEEDKFLKNRENIRDLFFVHKDGKSSERFLEAIGLLSSEEN